jgi:hypothetical protein
MKAFETDIKKYRDKQYIEIELRLGKINHNIFDTNIGSDNFSKILKSLEGYKGWEEKTVVEDEVYYWPSGVRCVYSDGECVYQKKNKILNRNFQLDEPMDVRLGISQEIPADPPTDDASRSVTRKRFSFLRKNVRIDMTMVFGQPDDKDSEDSTSYQVEFEILSVKTDQEIFSALNKVHDLLRCLLIS